MDDIEKAVLLSMALAKTVDVYFGIGLRKEKLSMGEGGKHVAGNLSNKQEAK